MNNNINGLDELSKQLMLPRAKVPTVSVNGKQGKHIEEGDYSEYIFKKK
jgi:hypothetical protein